MRRSLAEEAHAQESRWRRHMRRNLLEAAHAMKFGESGACAVV